MRSRWFLVGWLLALGAWLLHVAALALAPMSVVQAVLSAGIVALAVMAERLFGLRVGRRQWLGLGSSARGLQDGEAVPVIAVTGTAATVVCIAGGIVVFGDPLPGDPFG